MKRQRVAPEAAAEAKPWPDLTAMPIDSLPSLDDPEVEPAVTALLDDVQRPLNSVAGSQGS